MEEGFPGSLYLKIVYRLSGNELKMEYEAMSDQDTLINIANHSFFNLSAKDSKIYDQIRLHVQMRMVFQQVSFWM